MLLQCKCLKLRHWAFDEDYELVNELLDARLSNLRQAIGRCPSLRLEEALNR